MPISFSEATGISDLPSWAIPGTSAGVSATFNEHTFPVIPTYQPGTGEGSWFDTARTVVGSLFDHLPEISKATIDMRQAFTSSGAHNTPVYLLNGQPMGTHQTGGFVPGFSTLLPSFASHLTPSPAGVGSASGGLPSYLLIAAAALAAFLIFKGKS